MKQTVVTLVIESDPNQVNVSDTIVKMIEVMNEIGLTKVVSFKIQHIPPTTTTGDELCKSLEQSLSPKTPKTSHKP